MENWRAAFALLIVVSPGSAMPTNSQGRQSPARLAPVTTISWSPAASAGANGVGAAGALPAAARPDQVIRTSGLAVQADPANRDAARIKISTLLGEHRFDQALSTYDEYTSAVKKPDAGLLALAARADLRRLRERVQGDPILVAGALERLARDGDADALRALERASTSASPASRGALAPLVSLVRLGHERAAERLGALLDSADSDQKADMIRVIQDAGARSQAPRIAALLTASQPQVRSSAALAVGVLQFADAVPRLQELFETDVPVVRMFAAAALKRLGQTSADAYLAELIRRDLPEVRLIAAEAYQGASTKQWIPFVRQLLTDQNEISRLRAAELLACCDQPSARAALLDALNSANPSMRAEAARILEGKRLADLRIARRLLGDSADGVRLHGAGSALQAAHPQ